MHCMHTQSQQKITEQHFERRITMKDIYTAPELEIITFESEDVITTSPTTPDVII